MIRLRPAGEIAAEITARYLAGFADAAIVAQSGQLDDQVDRLVAEGWTLEGTRSFAGKRIRTLRPPLGWDSTPPTNREDP